jgi:NADH:ubiquinone oxidoreductase subunit 6 (subunit J)
MSLYDGIFYFFSIATALAAAGLLLSRNVLYGSLFVIVCLLSVAALYVLAFAEFVAVTQILVYAGGILVVIIFGIMLTAKFGNVPLRVQHKNLFTGFMVAGPLLFILVFIFKDLSLEKSTLPELKSHANQVQSVGIYLMTDYVLIFEVAGVLLLIALIGAAVIASGKPKEV